MTPLVTYVPGRNCYLCARNIPREVNPNRVASYSPEFPNLFSVFFLPFALALKLAFAFACAPALASEGHVLPCQFVNFLLTKGL